MSYRINAGTLQTFTVDGKNQLTNSTPGGYATFDGNGNTLTVSATPRHFAYDDENQLVAITNNLESFQPKLTTLVYDGKLRLRLRREYDWEPDGGGDDSATLGNFGQPDGPGEGGNWVLVSETRYLYDGNRVIQERDVNNTPTVSYTRGPDLSGTREGAGGIGGLLARSHGYSSGSWSTHNFYHADGNGNVTYLVDASQALAASYRYDAYGNTLSSSGSLASANVYRFSSKEQHTGSGLYYYLYRWYDPNVQRWLNRDPISERGGVNLYGFVRNAPSRYIDPYGLHNPITGPDGVEVGSGDGLPDPSVFFPDLPPAPPPPPPPCQSFAGGVDIHLSWVNPFTSGAGTVIGANQMTFFEDNTTAEYVYDGSGILLDVGVAAQSVWAWGAGEWTGPFESVSINAGVLTGSIFWSPGEGGWIGFTFGVGLGLSGGALEATDYYELTAEE